jgi:hypothetical protein
LIKTAHQHLLLLVGFDTLIYRKYYDTPPILVGHQPATRVHNITAEGMEFTITETLRASMVEMWLHAVKQRFLDAAPIKCVGLDCEFTTPRDKLHQRAAILQLSVASEVLVFQICRADHVPQLLRDFLGDPTIRLCGAAIGNDVRMLQSYRIQIPSVYDL